jgi:hypothetical protein
MQDDRTLVTIATFDTGTEAMLAKGALEAIGIRAWFQKNTYFVAALKSRLERSRLRG